MYDDMIRWETAMHERASSAQVADYRDMRLYVKRAVQGSRYFFVKINGRYWGQFPNLSAAKEHAEKTARDLAAGPEDAK